MRRHFIITVNAELTVCKQHDLRTAAMSFVSQNLCISNWYSFSLGVSDFVTTSNAWAWEFLQSIAISMFVCLSVCLSVCLFLAYLKTTPRDQTSRYIRVHIKPTFGRGSFLLATVLPIFVDNAIVKNILIALHKVHVRLGLPPVQFLTGRPVFHPFCPAFVGLAFSDLVVRAGCHKSRANQRSFIWVCQSFSVGPRCNEAIHYLPCLLLKVLTSLACIQRVCAL